MSQLYRWIDEQGVVHWTNRLDSVPEQYRSRAKQTTPSWARSEPSRRAVYRSLNADQLTGAQPGIKILAALNQLLEFNRVPRVIAEGSGPLVFVDQLESLERPRAGTVTVSSASIAGCAFHLFVRSAYAAFPEVFVMEPTHAWHLNQRITEFHVPLRPYRR